MTVRVSVQMSMSGIKRMPKKVEVRTYICDVDHR